MAGFNSLNCFNSSEMRTSTTVPVQDYIITEPASLNAQDEHYFAASRQPNGGYACHYCSKFMKDKNDMRRHIRMHTGEKLFQCPICGKCCSRKNNLKVHLQNVHRNVNL